MNGFPEKILLATDGSEDAARATEAASDLAKRSGAELHVVHVWHDVPGFAHAFVKRELRRQGQEVLDAQVEKIQATGATVAEAHLQGGRTSNEIIALSDEIGAGLLIVGSRGLGTVQRILMGSHSEEIVHHSHVPVLVLRGDEDAWPPEQIVIGEDFSDDARRAGTWPPISARSTAPGCSSSTPTPTSRRSPDAAPEAVQAITDMRERDEGGLGERATELETILGSHPETELSDGYPATVLLEAAARQQKPSLIAVGSRGLAGLTRTRLGSVSTKAVTASHGPVIVVPHVE